MKTWKNGPKKLLRIHNQQFFSLPAWLPKRPIFCRNRNLIGSPCLLSTISLHREHRKKVWMQHLVKRNRWSVLVCKAVFWAFLSLPSGLNSEHRAPTALPFHSGRMDWKTVHLTRPQGCQKMCQDPLNSNLEVWCTNMELKLHNLQKTVKIAKKSSKNMFSYSFSKIMQFKLHISAPDLWIWI